MEAWPAEVGGDGDVADEVLVGEDLGLDEGELRLREGADLEGQRLVFRHAAAFQDLVVERLKLVAVRDVLAQDFLRTLSRPAATFIRGGTACSII